MNGIAAAKSPLRSELYKNREFSTTHRTLCRTILFQNVTSDEKEDLPENKKVMLICR
jgi:hypothetical protein